MTTPLFKNALASIRMGVEDFRQQDADRNISAVRNLYAGILLLAKEAIIRMAPEADSHLVIGAKLQPVPDGKGGIAMKQVGHATIDFNQISERAKAFGVALDAKALNQLNKIRNDIEHHYTSESATAIRAAVSQGFPVIASLLRQMDEDPVAVLGDTWSFMLEVKVLYDQELAEVRATLANVEWYVDSLSDVDLPCLECQSRLVEQLDPENTSQRHATLRCRTCGASPDIEGVIEKALSDLFEGEAYSRAKEGGGEGPLYDCPSCNRKTILEGEDVCANCNESLDFERTCQRCGNDITIQDYLDGLDDGICSYCSYVWEKVMRE